LAVSGLNNVAVFESTPLRHARDLARTEYAGKRILNVSANGRSTMPLQRSLMKSQGVGGYRDGAANERSIAMSLRWSSD
jgi:hypothetical protein